MVESPRKMTIVITGEGERLMTTMDEKHRFGLIEVSQTKFLVRGIANCWIEFVPNRDPNDNGAIRQLKLSCNGEQLIARRQ